MQASPEVSKPPVPATVFRLVNRAMILMWRLGLGPLINATHRQTGRMLVLGTRGRKSGYLRRTPLNYTPGDDAVYVMAGWGSGSDWCKNLHAAGQAEVWLAEGAWKAAPEVVSAPDERLRRLRGILLDSGFAATAFARIDPRRISDNELAARTEGHDVIRLSLVERRPGGVADLWWVWVGAAAAAVVAWLVLK